MHFRENGFSLKFIVRNVMLLTLSILLTTCKKDHLLDCFKSSGKSVSETRTAIAFNNINMTNNVDLIIHPDTIPYIKVTAGDNLIDGIITELSGNTLYIRNENRCNWMRSFNNTFTVEVGMDKPANIYNNGSGNIHCSDTIRSDVFVLDCFNGSGSINLLFNSKEIHLTNHVGRTDIHANGKTDKCFIYINDVGTMDAAGLESSYCYIRNSSTGDCRINVKDELGYEILYNGNIYLSGRPHLFNELITGSGKFFRY